jgi:hypothetical protein
MQNNPYTPQNIELGKQAFTGYVLMCLEALGVPKQEILAAMVKIENITMSDNFNEALTQYGKYKSELDGTTAYGLLS